MFQRKKKFAFVSPVLTLALIFLCHTSVYAAVAEKQAVTVQLTGYGGETDTLRIGAGENLNDSQGNLLLKEGEEIRADFSKEGGICTAQAELYKGVRYYISDGTDKVTFVPEDTVCRVSFSSRETESRSEEGVNDTVSSEEAGEPSTAPDSGTALGIKTKSPKAVTEGEMLKCVVSSLSGASGTESDTFLLQCEVPEGTVLESVYIGSYNRDVRLDLICRTEKDGQWHAWGEGISSAMGETFMTDTVSLSEGDRICSFAVSAPSAPEGFCLKEEDPCYYYVRIVDKENAGDYKGLTKVTAYLDGEKSSSESRFTTMVQENVHTGDSNVIFTGSLILLCVSVLTLVSYVVCRVIFYKKEKAAGQVRLPVVYNKGKDRGTHEKMSELLQKKPG